MLCKCSQSIDQCRSRSRSSSPSFPSSTQPQRHSSSSSSSSSSPSKSNQIKSTRVYSLPNPNPNPSNALNPTSSSWEYCLSTLSSLYPLYVSLGAALACLHPSAFHFFVHRAPASYSASLAFIMLSMGLTLQLNHLLAILNHNPFSFTIMPAFGSLISKLLGLPPSLSVGLILLGCCPGGTASNVVTLIAQGDVPLSIVMTVSSTLAAVLLTPLLTNILAGAYVPVDAMALSISTLQVVVAPILLGSYVQTTFPSAVRAVVPFAPLLAVLTSSLLASSVFSENFVRLKSSLSSAASDTGDMKAVLLAVILIHFFGFFVGYLSAMLCGLNEKQRRAISIEVGMQNSSLGVVLATSHFRSPLVALPAALSAVVMNIMGSSLGFVWRYVPVPVPPSESDDNQQSKFHD